MRLQLLGKYAIDKVVNTVDSLRRSATGAPAPVTANPNEPVELTFRVGVGKLDTVRSCVLSGSF